MAQGINILRSVFYLCAASLADTPPKNYFTKVIGVIFAAFIMA